MVVSMHDKLKLLLDQLKYDSNNYTYFKDGNLRIIIDSKSGVHTFCCCVRKYQRIFACLSESFRKTNPNAKKMDNNATAILMEPPASLTQAMTADPKKEAPLAKIS